MLRCSLTVIMVQKYEVQMKCIRKCLPAHLTIWEGVFKYKGQRLPSTTRSHPVSFLANCLFQDYHQRDNEPVINSKQT